MPFWCNNLAIKWCKDLKLLSFSWNYCKKKDETFLCCTSGEQTEIQSTPGSCCLIDQTKWLPAPSRRGPPRKDQSSLTALIRQYCKSRWDTWRLPLRTRLKVHPEHSPERAQSSDSAVGWSLKQSQFGHLRVWPKSIHVDNSPANLASSLALNPTLNICVVATIGS